MATRIDGQCMLHKVISDECREKHGEDGAWNIVRRELHDAILNAYEQTHGQGFKIHVVLTCERPPRHAREDETPVQNSSEIGPECCPSCGATGPCECL